MNRLEDGFVFFGKTSGGPEHVGGGQGCMATQGHFNSGCKPPKTITHRNGPQEGGFGVLHLGRNRLHPGGFGGSIEKANGRRISFKWPRSKCINNKDWRPHGKRLPEPGFLANVLDLNRRAALCRSSRRLHEKHHINAFIEFG